MSNTYKFLTSYREFQLPKSNVVYFPYSHRFPLSLKAFTVLWLQLTEGENKGVCGQVKTWKLWKAVDRNLVWSIKKTLFEGKTIAWTRNTLWRVTVCHMSVDTQGLKLWFGASFHGDQEKEGFGAKQRSPGNFLFWWIVLGYIRLSSHHMLVLMMHLVWTILYTSITWKTGDYFLNCHFMEWLNLLCMYLKMVQPY